MEHLYKKNVSPDAIIKPKTIIYSSQGLSNRARERESTLESRVDGGRGVRGEQLRVRLGEKWKAGVRL